MTIYELKYQHHFINGFIIGHYSSENKAQEAIYSFIEYLENNIKDINVYTKDFTITDITLDENFTEYDEVMDMIDILKTYEETKNL